MFRSNEFGMVVLNIVAARGAIVHRLALSAGQ